jgi:hypothetical protein
LQIAYGVRALKADLLAAERERCIQAVRKAKSLDENGYITEKSAAIEAIRALEPASGEYVLGWRDISTAPKDGTKVDVWSEKHGRQADARYNPDEYTFGVPWGWSSPWMGRITDATHWKPLDAPPLNAASSNGSGK